TVTYYPIPTGRDVQAAEPARGPARSGESARSTASRVRNIARIKAGVDVGHSAGARLRVSDLARHHPPWPAWDGTWPESVRPPRGLPGSGASPRTPPLRSGRCRES